jgi:hypothetical protein
MSAIAFFPLPVCSPDAEVFSPSALSIRQSYRLARQHFVIPVSQSDTRIKEVLTEIEEYQMLGDNWDLEGARAVDGGAAQLASRIIRLADRAASKQGVSWKDPVAGPVSDGGMSLEWEGKGRQVLMLTHPGQPCIVECILRVTGSKPNRQLVSIEGAVELALGALASED